MQRGSTGRAGAYFASIAALVLVFALVLAGACSPLQLDLTFGDGGSLDATVAPDVYDAASEADSFVGDSGPAADGEGGVADTSPPADAESGVPAMPCAKATDCPATSTTPICDTDAGVCVQCVSASDCSKGGSSTPHCVNNVCYACLTSADCGDAGSLGMTCNRFIPRCASICTMGSMCASQNLICNSATNGYCVECLDDTYCVGSATGARCYVAAGACGCDGSADCPSSHPTCGPPSITQLRFCQ
jgi:hypothetical protein